MEELQVQVPTITDKQAITLVATLLHVTMVSGLLLLLLMLANAPIIALLAYTTLPMALAIISLDLGLIMQDVTFAHIAKPTQPHRSLSTTAIFLAIGSEN